MNRQRIAQEILSVAKELTAGSWSSPSNPGDVAKIIKMVKRMAAGEKPLLGRPRPEDAFYEYLGDDDLFDSFISSERYYYKSCADSVVRRVRELAKQPVDSFKDPQDHAMIVELAKKL